MAVEDIGATRKHPPVRREGVRTCAVVRGTGEGRGGVNMEEPQDQDFWGGYHRVAPSSTRPPPAPPLRLPSNTSSTVGEQVLRHRGDRSGRFGGGHLGIGWRLSEAGGQ